MGTAPISVGDTGPVPFLHPGTRDVGVPDTDFPMFRYLSNIIFSVVPNEPAVKRTK
jgi:hypothetical protein